ncbi:MAG: 3'(2'),5'-bisphosphate nucleotidase CysQ [Bradymonadia bacterium]
MLDHSTRIAIRLACDAAAEVKRIYAGQFGVETKADGSPVTDADKAANDIILAGLEEHFPEDNVLSEETPFDANRALGRRIWFIDPLDGTKDFVNRTGDFAVMIGLCVAGRPLIGVVAAPALDTLWVGVVGQGAFEERDGVQRPLTISDTREGPLRMLCSRSHRPPQIETLAERLGPAELHPRGSVGVKISLLAAGEADLYLHPTAGTSLWDCCAPEAILRAAGGEFTKPDGSLITYDPMITANPDGILAAGPTDHARAVSLLAESPA